MKALLFLVAAALAVALCAGVLDASAAGTVILANGAAAVDLVALEKAMKGAFDALGKRVTELNAMVLDLAQNGTRVPYSHDGSAQTELADLILKADGSQIFAKKQSQRFSIEVPSRLLVRNAITNVPPGTSDPLRQPDRSRGIVSPPQMRLTIRGLFAQLPTSNGTIDVCSEATFTNNAAPQGGDASPTGSGEGAPKAESTMTFTVDTKTIPTIAHFITASRQVLSDAPLLQSYLEGRLLFGLALEEEAEMLTGTGAAGEMNGINSQASAFTGGVTNATAIDTVARAINQLQVSNFEPSAVILSPSDWLNSFKLAKDSQGRYLIGDPAQMTTPALWGLPVIPTSSQAVGRFTVLDARQLGYIADRETAEVRISENVGDNFIKNLITILAEERALLVIERPTAAVYGVLSTPG